MNKLDRLYKKALIETKDKRSKELVESSIKFMRVWIDIMSYCYSNNIVISRENKEFADLYQEICKKCGHASVSDDFVDWYFDENNESLFITRDYGNGEIEFGYQT